MADPLNLDAIRRELSPADGWSLRVFDLVDSTNTLALGLAADGAPHGVVCLAESQHAGRGRGERIWRTPHGSALAMSIILRPSIERGRWPWIGLAAAVAVVDAIDETTGAQARVKWPNDVLIGEKKVAGILVESRSQADSSAVVGIGINVNNRSAALPEDVRSSAVSLLDATGRVTDRNRLAAGVLNMLARRLAELPHDIETAARRWNAASATRGRYLSILTPGGSLDGIDQGLDASGRLLILGPDGGSRAIHSGDVLLCRTAPPPLL